MKLSAVIVSLFLASMAFAKTNTFKVQVSEVSVNGSLDIQPRSYSVNPNEIVVISRSFNAEGKNTIVEMIVADDNSKIKDGILIKLSIFEEVEGTKKLISTPQMLVKPGVTASMTEGKEGETPFVKTSLSSTRIQ